jgi:exonuclease SbcC
MWQRSLNQTQQAIAHWQQQLEITATEIQAQTKTWQEQQANLRARINSEQQNLRKLSKQQGVIVQAGHDGICPTCERPLHQEYDTVVGNFTNQINHLETHIHQWQEQLKAIEPPPPALRDLQQQQTQLNQNLQTEQRKEQQLTANLTKQQLWQQAQEQKQTEVTEITTQIAAIPSGFDAATYAQLEQQLKQLEPKREEFLRLANAPQQLQEIESQLSELAQEKAQTETAIAALQTQLTQLNFDPQEYAQVKQAIATANQELDAARIAQSEANQKVALTQQRLEAAQSQEAEFYRRDAEYQKAKQELILLDELDSAFTELRQYLTEQIRPQLAESASIFLTQLTDGRYDAIEIDPKYNILVLDHGDPKPVISGGEEDIVNLCLRLAISQMITERSGQPFSLLILDEVFGSLDHNRRDNVIGLLHALEQQFEQVLIITHIEAIKEGVNQAIRLEFDPQEQCSRLASI